MLTNKVQKVMIIAVVLSVVFLTGCQKTQQKFPESMVGVWQSKVGWRDTDIYAIQFEPDGKISKIIHNVAGPLDISKGGSSGEGSEPDTYYMFVLGPSQAEYDAQKKEITVEIRIDNFEMKVPQGTLRGKIVDKFNGPVTKDGRTWKVQWRCYGWLEDAEEPDIKEIDNNPQELIFKRLDLTGRTQDEVQ